MCRYRHGGRTMERTSYSICWTHCRWITNLIFILPHTLLVSVPLFSSLASSVTHAGVVHSPSHISGNCKSSSIASYTSLDLCPEASEGVVLSSGAGPGSSQRTGVWGFLPCQQNSFIITVSFFTRTGFFIHSLRLLRAATNIHVHVLSAHYLEHRF